MKETKRKKAVVRRWVGTIMSVVGAGAAAFFTYVWRSGLWNTVDEAGNSTGSGAAILLIVASILILVRGIDILIHKDEKNRKNFTINLPEI